MSYTPTIIIRKSDLEKNRERIENAEWDTIAKRQFKGRNAKKEKQHLIDAYNILRKALDFEIVKFPEIELIILYVPESTSENQRVRDLLDTLKIDYRIYH